MADKTTTSQAGAAPTADSPAAIRNVVLVGPSGGGKTTLVEALLVAAGVLNRPGSVVDGTTVCDCDEAEISQQRSVGLALASLEHGGVKVNLIDTPGYADFVGELRAGLRAADCALFVIAANEEIDQPTKSLWLECSQVGMPRAVLVTKLDHARANYDNALDAAQQAFGDKVLPLYLPADSPCSGLIGLLSQTHFEYANGKRSTSHEPDASYGDAITELRGSLIEGIIEESEDETLMERYLGGEEIDQSVLIDDLEKAIARGSFFPVIPVCSTTGVGTLELLEVITSGFPSPPSASSPRCSPPRASPATACRAIRQDRFSPRSSRRPRIPMWAASAWCECSPEPSPLTRRCMCPATSRRSTAPTAPPPTTPTPVGPPATPTMTRTSASAPCRSHSASNSGRRRRWWPATSVPSGGCPAPRPATRSRRSPTRWCSSRGPCPNRCCRWPCSHTPRPTRTSSRSGCSGWRPRIRRCASSRIPNTSDRAVDHGRSPRRCRTRRPVPQVRRRR